MPESTSPKEFLRRLKPRLPQMLATLRRFVEAESPSLEKAAADRCCGLIASAWRKYDVGVERFTQKHRGDHLRISYGPGKTRSAGQLLVLGHYDTVYSGGTLVKMPFRISRGKAYGPGIFDMKAGIVQALFALYALQEANSELRKRLVFLWTSDEEIGSESSRELLEAEARRSDAVFVLEPSFGPRGLLKTARKGVGTAKLTVHGHASHAGLAPQEGINAIHELAQQLARIEKWNDLRRGVTINAGIVEGGSRTNVIPERARASLEANARSAAVPTEISPLRSASLRSTASAPSATAPILRTSASSYTRCPPAPPSWPRFWPQLDMTSQMGISARRSSSNTPPSISSNRCNRCAALPSAPPPWTSRSRCDPGCG